MDKTLIKIQVPLATSARVYSPGEVTRWDREDALRLIKAGYALAVEEKVDPAAGKDKTK